MDGRNTVERTRAVCCFIKAKLPHVVFLQEVVSSTWDEIIKSVNSLYDCYSPVNSAPYFVAILTQKEAINTTGGLEVRDFSSSGMGRQLLQLPIRYAGADIHLMTSHLESTAQCKAERKSQLKIAFDIANRLCSENPERNCIFGGDLNLRDDEVRSVGLPAGMVDVWEVCGAPKDQRYTWDVTANDNLDWPYPRKPKCRFDRLYLMPGNKGGRLRVPSSEAAVGGGERFALVGKVRLSKCGGRFPSDHWGIWAEFEVI